VEQLLFGERDDGAEPDPQETYRTDYEIERTLAADGATCIAGVDEVGRGAWAGPVTVCAVVCRAGYPVPPAGLTDSKLLTPRRRTEIAAELLDWVGAYAIGEA
jgi:ribonuclease HII